MSEETKKENEQKDEEVSQKDENNQEVNQEDLAAQWEAETAVNEESVDQEDLAAQWAAETESSQKSKEHFADYEKSDTSKLSLLMDIPLEVTVEIGTTELPIEEILKLNPNSVIELDKMINEPVDLKVNGKLIAKGELYTVKNSFGIKITNIITPEDRLKILNNS